MQSSTVEWYCFSMKNCKNRCGTKVKNILQTSAKIHVIDWRRRCDFICLCQYTLTNTQINNMYIYNVVKPELFQWYEYRVFMRYLGGIFLILDFKQVQGISTKQNARLIPVHVMMSRYVSWILFLFGDVHKKSRGRAITHVICSWFQEQLAFYRFYTGHCITCSHYMTARLTLQVNGRNEWM